MSQNSKTKFEVYTDATAHLIPEAAVEKVEANKPRKASRGNREENEEPVYINRI